MENNMRMRPTPVSWHLSHACVWHTWRCADVRRRTGQQKSVRATLSVVTLSVVHTVVANTSVRNPKKTLSRKNSSERKMNIHHFMTILTKKILQFVVWVRWVYVQNPFQNSQTFIVPCPFLSFLLVLVPSIGFSSIIGSGGFSVSEACVTERPTFLISWFSMMPLYGLFPIVQDQDGTCWASWGSSRHFICGFRPASSIHANNGPLLISTCPVAGWIFSLTECEAFAPPSPWIPKTINVIHRSGGSGNALHELLDYLEAIKNRHFVHILDDISGNGMLRLWRLSIMLENSWIFCMYCLSL